MKALLLISIFITIASSTASFAQDTFIRAYGNTGFDYGRDIKQDTDTGYVVTGSSSSFGPDNGDAYLLKLDKIGDKVWSHNYGGTGSDWGEGLVVTNDSSYAIAGYTNSFGAGGFDFYLVRINQDGTPRWEKQYGGTDWDKAFGLVELPDSGFVLVGDSYSFNDGQRSAYMVRTDKNGDIVWESYIDEDIPSFFTDISLDGDSLVICGGIGDGGDETYDGFIYKCNIDGTFGWDKRIGREYNDFFNAIYTVAGVYSLGGSRGYNYPTEKENYWIYRTTDVGVEIIDTTWSNFSPNPDEINDVIARDFDQDYYYTGYTKSFGYDLDDEGDIFLAKTNLSGVTIANTNYGELGKDVGQAIDRTKDNGVVILADTEYFATGGNNILVIKLNPLWEFPEIFSEIIFGDITSSVEEEYLEEEVLTVYPNPFDSYIIIPEIKDGIYSIYTLSGKLLLENKIEDEQINLDVLSSGTYLLTIQTDEGIYKKRLVKN